MKQLVSILVASAIIFSAEVADISFGPSWVLDNGVTLNGTNDTLTIVGSTSEYRQAQLTLTVNPVPRDLYLVADVYLSGLVPGDVSYKTAKFKIWEGGTTTNILAMNMDATLLDEWYNTAMVVERFDNKGVSYITLEFAIQNAEGTMLIANPRLLDAPLPSAYEFPFTTPADPTCYIDLKSDSTRAFPPHLLSVNSHFVWANGDWGDPTVRDIINNRLPLGNLRFPGGTVGNFYDWETDGFYGDSVTFASPSRENAYNNNFRFGYSDYASLCVESGATSTLMFNVIQDSPTKAANRLSDRLASGVTIDWIELGNENFYYEQHAGNVYSSSDDNNNPDAYIAHTKLVTAALKAVDSTVKVAVNLDHSVWSPGSWNALMAQEAYYDAGIIHPYVQTNTSLVNKYSAKIMMSAYKTTKERIHEFATALPGVPLLATEWGVLSDGSPSNFVQALGTADLFLALLEGNDEGIVQQMGVHMLYHSDNYNEATLYYGDNGTMMKTRLGVLYETLVNFFTGNELYDAVGYGGELETDLPGVIARAVQVGDTTKFLVVNKLPVSSPLAITIDGQSYSGTHEIVSFNEQMLGDSSGYALDDIPFVGDLMINKTGNPDIPPYSIALVTLNDVPAPIHAGVPEALAPHRIISTSQGLRLTFPTAGHLKVVNAAGRVVLDQKDFTVGTVGVNLPRGVYMLQHASKTQVIREKISVR